MKVVNVTHATNEALALERITKHFGSLVALDGASFTLRAGTVHALLGENGAGKTTLMRIAYGMHQPDSGEIRVGGTPRSIASPADALALGLGMVHQHFTLVDAMTVAENVALGGRGRYDAREAAARVREIGERTGLRLDPEARVATLGVGAQQRLEIVKALARDVQTLILDEPTAVLAPAEATELLRWLRTFVESGHSAVLITHKLREALGVADDVTVLRHGRSVLASAARAVTERELAGAMLGDEIAVAASAGSAGSALATAGVDIGMDVSVIGDASRDALGDAERGDRAASNRAGIAPPVLSASRLTYRDERGVTRVREATFDVAGGEILGVAAVEGAGQHELLRLLAARIVPTGGTLVAPEQIGFVPEDRHRDALLLDGTLVENVALRDAGRARGRMPWRALTDATQRLLAEHDVRAPGPTVRARSLSGGNQQKLVLGRELAGRPAALVVENPTRGLDIRATAAVHAQLRAARDEGTAVVVYSSDLDEVLALADRVIVVYDGQVTPVGRDREVVGRMMLGVA